MPLELIEDILDYLDVIALRGTIRTAKFLRYPSEKRLYRRVIFPATSNSWDAQACFLETIAESDCLGQHVVKFVLGRNDQLDVTRRARVNQSIGEAMKKMVNLKELDVYGGPAIINAHLDSVPFSLTHLVLCVSKFAFSSYSIRVIPFLSIIRAHPNLEDLALCVSDILFDLETALKEEQDRHTSKNDILCPKLKRFEGSDKDMRLFLPMRKIECRRALRSPALAVEYIADEQLEDVWLIPALKESYRHLRSLEVCPYHREARSFLTVIAPYLTSLTHLHVLDNLHRYTPTDDVGILHSLGRIQALRSVTFTDPVKIGIPVWLAREIAETVRTICPNIREVFVQDCERRGEEPNDAMYYQSARRNGVVSSAFVSRWIACKPYADWVDEQ